MGSFWGLSGQLKSTASESLQKSITASARLLQPTVLLLLDGVTLTIFPMKNPPLVMRPLSSKFFDHLSLTFQTAAVQFRSVKKEIPQLLWKLAEKTPSYDFVAIHFRPVRRKQGVALTGRNTTGLPCSRGAIIRLEAAWRHCVACEGEAACRPAVECYRRRRQTPASKTILAPYTICRRASNKSLFVC